MNFLDNTTIQGGIGFKSPSVSVTAQNASINGGFNFDLPLAIVASFQDGAYNFMSANTQSSRNFLTGVIGFSQSALSSQIQQSQFDVTAGVSQAYAFGGGQFDKIFKTALTANQQYYDSVKSAAKQRSKDNIVSGFLSPMSPCFITTAICETEDKPDDCEELTILRKFRDDFLMVSDYGTSLVEHYYAIAPGIVEKINALTCSGDYWRFLKVMYLLPIISLINQGSYEAAVLLYRKMVAVAQVFAGE